MSLAAIDNRLAVHPYYGSTIPPYLRNTDQVFVSMPGVSSSRARTVPSTVRIVTEPAATGPSPAAIDPSGTLPYAGQVVRRVLLRRNIVIDADKCGDSAARRGRRPGRAPGR